MVPGLQQTYYYRRCLIHLPSGYVMPQGPSVVFGLVIQQCTQYSLWACCSITAQYVSAIVTAFPCLVPPLHVTHAILQCRLILCGLGHEYMSTQMVVSLRSDHLGVGKVFQIYLDSDTYIAVSIQIVSIQRLSCHPGNGQPLHLCMAAASISSSSYSG